jgi:hypothetical protein
MMGGGLGDGAPWWVVGVVEGEEDVVVYVNDTLLPRCEHRAEIQLNRKPMPHPKVQVLPHATPIDEVQSSVRR